MAKKFRYKHGDRPLDGYTVEHGLGVGGFGEVYYAVSDSGREVALKAVQNYEEVELRGIRHCMNLKSPHLVSVFDVRFNDDETPFVIMEYVQGPSLRALLDESPEGLGPTKSAFFLREMARGLSYLHEAGVVHRDLKPHNVFYEEGYVKIGDYSLCKMISTSHRSGHTMTVGTVHYMAPEISQGRYDASVDIYALGVMLYEMLTGHPPFVGDSMGEVLMKHMTAEPDLSGIDEPFRSTIARALAKEPEQRFASVAEMVESVFGEEHVQNSVVEFNPQELTMVAGRVANKVLTTPSGRMVQPDRPSGGAADDSRDRWGKTWKPDASSVSSGLDQTTPRTPGLGSGPNAGLGPGVAAGINAPPPPPGTPSGAAARQPRRVTNIEPTAAELDAMPPEQRHTQTIFTIAALAVLLSNATNRTWGVLVCYAAAIALPVGLTHMFQNGWGRQLSLGRSIWPRMVLVGLVLVSQWFTTTMVLGIAAWGIALPFLFLDWHYLTHPRRRRRISGGSLLVLGFASLVMAVAMQSSIGMPRDVASYAGLVTATLTVGIGLCMQLFSPVIGQPSVAGSSPAAGSGSHPDYPQATTPPAAPVAASYASAQAPPAGDAGFVAANFANSDAVVASVKPAKKGKSSEEEKQAMGLIMFVASSVLAVVALGNAMPNIRLLPAFVSSVLCVVGFGLLVGSFGILIASGQRRGWAVLRTIAAVCLMGSLFMSLLMNEFEVPFALAMPLAVGLFAWPTREPGT